MATAFVLVHRDSYHDSVLLMRLSQALKGLAGAEDAVVAMGTPHNRELLAAQGYDGPILAGAGPNDLLIAVRGAAELSAAVVEAELERLLHSGGDSAEGPGSADGAGPRDRPTSLAAALKARPDANLVVISVPGEHAARVARRALALGRHVLLFSDNVALEEEVALKREAVARGLLMMGPDCGTAILNGKPLAFANVVRRGAIGIVGAAGTGIQEVTSVIHRLGGGVSQAIGTGGRDLSDAVGGLTTLLAIDALASDPATRVLVVISKPPSPLVARKVVAALVASGKPCVAHFVGSEPASADDHAPGGDGAVTFAYSLAGTAAAACRLAGVTGLEDADGAALGAGAAAPDPSRVAAMAAQLAPGAVLRGLFCGGTTGQEALALLTRAGLEVHSNLHKKGPLRLDGVEVALSGHVLLDLGDDVFTRGRPHPMIEPALRNERLAQEAADPQVGLVLFDCVLGYGSHADPAGVLARGVEEARALRPSHPFVSIASITGTDEDPQDYREQARRLCAAGILVESDNASAASLAAAVLRHGRKAAAR